MKTLQRFLILILILASAVPAFSQAANTTITTTLNGAITDTKNKYITLTSVTSMVASGASAQYFLYVDKELMQIQAITTGTNTVQVIRGAGATVATKHNGTETAYFGQMAIFDAASGNVGGAQGGSGGTSPIPVFLSGAGGSDQPIPGTTCVSSNELYLPLIHIPTGRQYNCINGRWMIDDGQIFMDAGNCQSSVSANSSGTNGLTTVGTSNVPVIQASTSGSGTNTHIYRCILNIATRLNYKGISVKDIVFFYGVQTSALGTQASVLASGTMNADIVFSKITTFPVASASETPSTVTTVRADTGTLVITPVVASFATATTTAGAFASVQFIPSAGIDITADYALYILEVTFQCAPTSATITNSPGFTIHYAYIP